MSFKSTIIAAAALMASANAHIIMTNPTPYAAAQIDNAPLISDGSNFPCKSNLGFSGDATKISVGSKQTIAFKGSAVHNGGLCQLSVASIPSSQKPDKNTVFKVIKTIEGGCPGLDSGTKTFDWQLPDSIPNGDAVFAWTWMPVSSGGPEYYMNCAPIEVSGGSSDKSKFNQLPDMLVANLAGITTCKQVVNTILKAPNPGSVVETDDTSKPLTAPTGECGSTGSGSSSNSSSSVASGQPASSAAASEPSSVPSSAASEPSAVSSVAAVSSAAASSAAATNNGGVFAPSASAAQSTLTTLLTVTAVPSASDPVASVPDASTPVGTGSTSQPTTGSGSGSSTCTTNGAIVCNGTTQFGICNNGNVVWQNVASGTTCSNGTIQKREYNGRVARPRII